MPMYYTPVLNLNHPLKKALFSLVSRRNVEPLTHVNFRNLLDLKPSDHYAFLPLSGGLYCAFSINLQRNPEGQRSGFMFHDPDTHALLPIYGRVAFISTHGDDYVPMPEAVAFNFLNGLKTEPASEFSDSPYVADTVYLFEKPEGFDNHEAI